MSDLKKREFASSFVLTIRSKVLTHTTTFKKDLRGEAMSRKKNLNDMHVSMLAKLRLRTVNAQLASSEVRWVKMWKKCMSHP